MRWCRKDSREACFPVLRKLLGQARERRRVKVELVSGLSFIDEVMSLEGSESTGVAVFSSRTVAVTDIETVTLELA